MKYSTKTGSLTELRTPCLVASLATATRVATSLGASDQFAAATIDFNDKPGQCLRVNLSSTQIRRLLVVGEAHYPGWTAQVNGASAPILHAYGALRAVPVPAGQSTVSFRFRSRPLRAGLAISALAWLFLLAALEWFRRARASAGRSRP